MLTFCGGVSYGGTYLVPKANFIFIFNFLHMLGDILVKLNKLNKVFQFNHIDITHIGRNPNICTSILINQYLFHRD